MIWAGQEGGAKAIISCLSISRPFYGVISALYYSLLGNNQLLWHASILLVRWLGALALLWGLRGLWPKQSFATTAISVLFVVYPGFLQQPVALNYLGGFTAFTLGIFSLAATIRAERAPNRNGNIVLTALAMVSGLAYLLIWEVLIGLEALRLIFLWYVSRSSEKKSSVRVIHVGKRWLPNLVVVIGLLIWRVFFFTSTREVTSFGYVVDKYLEEPLVMLGRVPVKVWIAFLETAIFAWFAPSSALFSRLIQPGIFLVAHFLALAGGALVLFYYWGWSCRKLSSACDESQESRSWAQDALFIGILAVLFAVSVPVLLYRSVYLSDGRYTYSASIGASLVVVSAMFLVIRPALRPWLLAALVGLSISTHFISDINKFGFDWKLQRDTFWQLSWRAPQIEPGTTLVLQSEKTAYDRFGANYLFGPINMIYSFNEQQTLLWGSFLTEDYAQRIEEGDQWKEASHGVFSFDVDSEKILIVRKTSSLSCLRVLDGTRMELPADADSLLRSVADYSRIDLIRANESPAMPPTAVFGEEPAHTWCYYFQKAELARQIGDWQQVAQIGDQARQLDFKPNDVTEWLPLIEGYANVGRYEDARETAGLALQAMPTVRPALCNLLERLETAKTLDTDRKAFVADVKAQLMPCTTNVDQ